MKYKCFIARYNVYTVIIESLSFQECDYKIEMYSIVPNPYDYVHNIVYGKMKSFSQIYSEDSE